MDQINNIYLEWRKKLNNVALIIACITLLLEIVVSYLMYEFLPGMIELPLHNYIILYIVLPSSSYFFLVIIGRYIIYKKNFSDTAKNYYSIFILMAQIFIIACVHNVFKFTSILYIIPIILTLIYSNKFMTNIITIGSIGLMITSSMVIVTDARSIDSFHTIEAFIEIVLIVGCSLITNLLIDIEKDKNNIIKASSFKQLQFEELIKCDPLTGLYNIASFYSALDVSISNKEMPLTIAVIDIDNFKSVNDVWGHENANDVLIYVAAQLQAACSTIGHVYRYGGEEFTIIFPNTTPIDAKDMIEIAQKNIYHHDFGYTPKKSITFSCGIAEYPSKNYNAHDFFKLADKIMYQAKFSGKNKILIGTSSSVSN